MDIERQGQHVEELELQELRGQLTEELKATLEKYVDGGFAEKI